MTVRTRHFGRVLTGLVVICFVAGGLSVEAITRAGVSRAERALPGALARAVASDTTGEAAASSLAAARQHVRHRQPAEAAAALERVAAEGPTQELHTAAALAWLAADRGLPAARHAQLAARLAPDNAEASAIAERAVDVALAYRLRPFSRPAGLFGGIGLLILAFSALARRREGIRLNRFLQNLSARVQVWADGEQLRHPLVLGPRTERLTLDLFLKGRYGMDCSKRPQRAPTLHLAFSSPGSNQTIRLRPLKDVTDNAIRIPVRNETLAKLLAQPGPWRLHVRLGERPVLALPLEVRAAQAKSPAGEPRAFALG